MEVTNNTYVKRFLFVGLIAFQIVPVAIILYYIMGASGQTENAGWIQNEVSNCRLFTEKNHENRTFVWSGDCKEGYVHGVGELTVFENTYKYYAFQGTLEKGKLEGKGTMTFGKDGDRYEGDFSNNLPEGEGHFFNDDGDHYQGQFKEGLWHGKGTYWYAPESPFFKYVGQWKEGKKNGRGILYYRNGKAVSGNFKNDVFIKN